ncbi:MAG: HD domain-containing protein [Candidatus Altiarchaeota archaeon]
MGNEHKQPQKSEQLDLPFIKGSLDWKYDPKVALDKALEFYDKIRPTPIIRKDHRQMISKRSTEAFDSDDTHGVYHGLAVAINIQEIATHTPELRDKARRGEIDFFNLYVAALFHDITQVNNPKQRVGHQKASAEYTSRMLLKKEARKEYGITTSDITRIYGEIVLHDAIETNGTGAVLSDENKLFNDADNLCKISPESFKRTISYGEQLGRTLFNPDLSDKERLLLGQSSEQSDSLSRMLYDIRTYGSRGTYHFGYSRHLAGKWREEYKNKLLEHLRKDSVYGNDPEKLEKVEDLVSVSPLAQPGITADNVEFDEKGKSIRVNKTG